MTPEQHSFHYPLLTQLLVPKEDPRDPSSCGAFWPTVTCLSVHVQPPKKPAVLEKGQASKLGHMLHPPLKYSPNSGLHGHHGNSRGPRPFGSFLDFLVKGQVLDSLQMVVEKATERMATMKTEAGVPLVEVQDPVEVPKGRRRVRARPSLSTMHRHRGRSSLCTGNPNNYPSCSSSMSDSHSNFTAGWLGSRRQDSDLGYHGLGPLPPMKDKLLQKSLKRLLRLENRGVRSGAMAWCGEYRAQPEPRARANPGLAAPGCL